MSFPALRKRRRRRAWNEALPTPPIIIHMTPFFPRSLWDFVQEREDRASYLSENDSDELSSLGIPFALRLAILDGSAESWSDDDLYDSD